MGVSAAPAKKRSFAGANAYRSAMPSYRPNQGGSTYGAPPPSNDDYTRAPPRLSVNDLCEEAGGAEAPTFGAADRTDLVSCFPCSHPTAPPRLPLRKKHQTTGAYRSFSSLAVHSAPLPSCPLPPSPQPRNPHFTQPHPPGGTSD